MFIPEHAAQVNMRWGGIALPHGAETTFGVSHLVAKTPQQIADIVDTALTSSNFMQSISNQCTITSILVKVGPNDEGLFYEKGVTHVGADAGQSVPPNTCILAKKVTGKGGRRNTGRWFIPGCPESASAGTGLILQAFHTDYQLNFNSFLTKLQQADIPMVLLHTEERPGEDMLSVTSFAVSNMLATQRRRLRG